MHAHIESLIFCSPEPVGVAELLSCLRRLHGEDVTGDAVEAALAEITRRYQDGPYPFEVVPLAGGYRFLTKPAVRPAVELLLAEQARRKLSAATLETLSVVAYRQPCTKAEVEAVRGVSCDYTLPKLLERGLIAMAGRKDAPGRPVLYQTTTKFLEHVGLHSLADLPPLPQAQHNEIGEHDPTVAPIVITEPST